MQTRKLKPTIICRNLISPKLKITPKSNNIKMLYKAFPSSCGGFQRVLQCRTNKITHRLAFAFWVFAPSDSFHCKLLFRNNRLHDKAFPIKAMKKTLSNCSPVILGIDRKKLPRFTANVTLIMVRKEKEPRKVARYLNKPCVGGLGSSQKENHSKLG